MLLVIRQGLLCIITEQCALLLIVDVCTVDVVYVYACFISVGLLMRKFMSCTFFLVGIEC